MSNRNLLILGLAAGLMAAWAVIQSRITARPYAPAKTGVYLIQGLDPGQIADINVVSEEGEVRLTRRGPDFIVADKDNYPAVAGEINKLISTCLDIKTAEMYTENPSNYKDLGVDENGALIVIKFYKSDSTLLTGVVIGKEKQEEQGNVFVKKVEDNKVYVSADQIPWVKKRPIDYIEQQIIDVKREDVNSVTVSYPDETYVLRPADDKAVVLENLPEGKSLKEDTANMVFNALIDLRFEDVNAEKSRPALKFDRRYISRLKDSTTYTIWLAKSGDEWFIKCDSLFADQTPITKTQGQVETEEQLKEKEAKLLARDAAEEFSDNHKGWVYKISEYKAQNLTKEIDELIEEVKTPADANEPPVGTSEPADK